MLINLDCVKVTEERLLLGTRPPLLSSKLSYDFISNINDYYAIFLASTLLPHILIHLTHNMHTSSRTCILGPITQAALARISTCL